MANKLSFTSYFGFVKLLVIFMLLISYFTAYLVEKKQNQLFTLMSKRYIEPQSMLNELKNTYDINILRTIELMHQGLIKEEDAVDILQLSRKLVKSSWDKYYSKENILKYKYSKKETSNLNNFYIAIIKIDNQIKRLIVQITNSSNHKDTINTLIANIQKAKYILDDLIIYNVKSVALSEKYIKKTRTNFIYIAGSISLTITIFLFYMLSVIGNKMNILNRENITKAKILSIKTQELEEATKAKSVFLANMSHEIRTPLNAIIGFINMLRENENDKEKLKFLSIIENSGKSLLNIISDILDYSKIESGNFSVEKNQFEVREPFAESVNLFFEKAKEKNINIKTDFDSNLPKYMLGDKLRIKQIVNNLLSNSIKFSSENAQIIIELEYFKEKDSLVCHVKDFGVGMSHEDAKKLFGAFVQVGAAKTGVSGGTGLGLSISKNLVRLMGGNIKVTSELGKGSDFEFNLPLHSNEVVEVNESEEESTLSNIEVSFENIHVLVVEDNKTNQMLLDIMLDDLGISCSIAENGLEAVELYKTDRDKFNLILMDENMPKMNGSEATIAIREYEKLNKLESMSIVAVTANAVTGDKERFLSLGMDAYISKPIEKDKLLYVINDLVKKNG